MLRNSEEVRRLPGAGYQVEYVAGYRLQVAGKYKIEVTGYQEPVAGLNTGAVAGCRVQVADSRSRKNSWLFARRRKVMSAEHKALKPVTCNL